MPGILNGGPREPNRPATAGTGRRHRHGMRLMHDRRHGTLAAAAIGGAGFSSRPAWSPFRCALRKRRRLTGSRATRRLSTSFNRVLSRSRRTRSRSTRARSAFSRSSSRRNRAFSRRRSSIGSVGFCSARRLTRLLCQNFGLSTSQTR